MNWQIARDGSLSARDDTGRWIGDCSVPRRAAEVQLRNLSIGGAVGCFLAPPHAAAIRAALERLESRQAIITILPDADELEIILHCEDFATDIATSRLHFAIGENWQQEMRLLLDRHIGLAVPTQFIRVPSSDGALIDSLISLAQPIFAEITQARVDAITSLRDTWEQPANKKLLVLADSCEMIWQNWGNVLAEALGTAATKRLDPHHPLQSSPLGLAQAATDCDAIVSVDISRADCSNILADELPWITWITRGSIPPIDRCGPNDRLMFLDPADADRARHAGWPAARVEVAAAPSGSTLRISESNGGASPFIAIIADTVETDPPADIDDFSSHRLLWELIQSEIAADPFVTQPDVDAYLESRMRKLHISEQTLDRIKLIARLIEPAYQQAIARMMSEANLPLKIFGAGWEQTPLSNLVVGTSLDRNFLAEALAPAVAMLHVWPDQCRTHAIDFAMRTAIRPGNTRANLLQVARTALAKPNPLGLWAPPALKGRALCEIVRR